MMKKTRDKTIVFVEHAPDALSLYGSMHSRRRKPYSLKEEMDVARQMAARHIAKEGLK